MEAKIPLTSVSQACFGVSRFDSDVLKAVFSSFISLSFHKIKTPFN